MNDTSALDTIQPLTLRAETAAEMMMSNPVSIRDNATVQEAVAFFTDKGFSAAPVIDEAGRPIGVLSRTDIIVHDRERPAPVPGYYKEARPISQSAERAPRVMHSGCVDTTRVADIMTPVVFSVTPEAPASRVVEEMVDLRVHRLFVVDGSGVLIGVVSALDILKRLLPS